MRKKSKTYSILKLYDEIEKLTPEEYEKYLKAIQRGEKTWDDLLIAQDEKYCKDEWQREEAVKTFLRRRDPGIVDQLLEMALKESIFYLKKRIIKTVKRRRRELTFRFFREKCHDQNHIIRAAAIESLGILKDTSSSQIFLQALDDKHLKVRERATWSLGHLRDNSSVPSLLEALKDKNTGVRDCAAWALGQFNNRAVVKVVVPELVGSLKDRSPTVRYQTARALGYLRDKSAVPALAETIKDRDHMVRWHALDALGEISYASAAKVLINVLDCVAQEDRLFTGRAIAATYNRSRSKLAGQKVLKLLEDGDPIVRSWTAEKLSVASCKRFIKSIDMGINPRLKRVLEEKNNMFRSMLAQELDAPYFEEKAKRLSEGLSVDLEVLKEKHQRRANKE